jgi:hypothetical protein
MVMYGGDPQDINPYAATGVIDSGGAAGTYGPAWNLQVIDPVTYAQKIQALVAQGMNPTDAAARVDTYYTTSESGRAAAIAQYMNGRGLPVPDYVTQAGVGKSSPTFVGYGQGNPGPGNTGNPIPGSNTLNPVAVFNGGSLMANNNTEETYSPFTAYLQALGLSNKNFYNPAQNYQISQYDPLSNIYNINRRMSLVNPSFDPGNYVSPWTSGNVGNATKLARETLSNLFGMNQENQGMAGVDYSPLFSGTDSVDSNGLNELQALIKTGLRGNLGSYISNKLPWEQQNWGSSQAAGGGGTFLDYLKNKYNLNSLVR